MIIVRSHCPISGAPIFMGLRTLAEHEGAKALRMRRDAERVRFMAALGLVHIAFNDLLAAGDRQSAVSRNQRFKQA